MSLKPLPQLRFTPAPVPHDSIGTPGRLEWIALSDLVIDERYQRAIMGAGEKNIRRMIEQFSWALFAPLVVALRRELGGDDRYAVIDGQHRAVAAKLHGGIETVPCLVLQCDVADEARAFAAINGLVTRLHTVHVFRARIAGGDPVAVAIGRLCKAAGVVIPSYPIPRGHIKPGHTNAVGMLETAFKTHGEKVLGDALKLLMAAKGELWINKATIFGATSAPAETKIGLADAIAAAAPKGIEALLREARLSAAGGEGKEQGHFAALLTKLFKRAMAASVPTGEDTGFIRRLTPQQLMRGRA